MKNPGEAPAKIMAKNIFEVNTYVDSNQEPPEPQKQQQVFWHLEIIEYLVSFLP